MSERAESETADDGQNKRLGFSYGVTYDLGQNRQIQLNGAFFMDDDLPTMNRKLDMAFAVLDRRRSIAEIPTIEGELLQRQKAAREIEEQIERIGAKLEADSGRSGPKRQPAQTDVAALENLKQNLIKVRLDIIDGEQALANAKKKAA